MRVFVEGIGFRRPAEVELPSEDALFLDALYQARPSARRLPWEQLWLSCEGRNLAFRTKPLSKLPLREGARIVVAAKLLGGGGDGGSTGAESRDAFLKMYKLPKADKVDPREEKLAKWTCCQLSGEMLTPPCVCDELGTLFNKDAVIKALIEKTIPRSLAHITSLRHLIPLKLTPKASNEAKGAVKDAGNYLMAKDAEIQFHCPITNLELNGAFRFCVHLKTGYVISARAVKEAPKAVSEVLGMEAAPEEWLPLNGSPEIVKLLRDRMTAKRKLSKKSKKRIRPSSEASQPKKPKAVVDYAPEEASKHIYASIFRGHDTQDQETFLCRSVGARGMNLT